MGNIVQCCHTLSHYFKCKDTAGQDEAERSPLLSSEESECCDDLEDDLLTVSAGVTNPSLEPEHFLFPDIILSSSMGGDMTLVEPMVCLLVSEEEEGRGEGVSRVFDPGQERSIMRRNRGFSEVETQTEMETQIGMGVQTQTETQAEVQTQTEMFVCLRSEDVEEKHEILQKVETSRGRHSENLYNLPSEKASEQMLGSETWSDIFIGLEESGKVEEHSERNKLSFRDLHEEAKEEEVKICILQTEQYTELQEENTEEADVLKVQQKDTVGEEHAEFTWTEADVKDKGVSVQSECTSVMPAEHDANNTEEKESQRKPTFDPAGCHVDPTQESGQDDEQMSERSHQNVNEKDLNTKTEMNLFEDDTDHSTDRLKEEHVECQENPPEREEDEAESSGLQEAVETDLTQEEEEGAERKKLTLFLVDRLFLAAPHVKAAPPLQNAESPEEAGVEQCDPDKKEQLSIRDIVDLQETGCTVRIQPPGTESLELQVSGQMLVAELHQVLMDHEVTCHRTRFSLQLGGTALDNLTELSCIQGLQDGALIKLVEDCYTVRDARLHLRHVCDLLRSLDPADAYNGVNGSSLSYLTFYTRGDKDGENVGKRRVSEKESVDHRPPEFILPGCKERPLLPLQPVRDDWKPLQCLRVLTMSSWNPPPGNRKMHGDLMYLNALTMEDRELNITSSTRGFYLNQSTAFNFNPKPAAPKIHCHSLVELLNHVSPAFRKNFSALQKRRVQLHPYERFAAPFQVFTWAAPHGEHTLDCVRAEETHASHMGQDKHTAGQSRDWNEELQGCRELPRKSLQERLHRERSVFKTNSDFVAAATQGAVAVIDGNVMPINPSEAPHMQMFIWNNIFLSLGFDISEHYRPLGGNTAAHAAATCDLRGAQAYASVDTDGLHTLGTAVVDYRGVRVIAQTIVPGILEKSQEQSLVYGSNDYGATVFTHPRFLELLDKTCKPLRIQRHQVLNHDNIPVELCSGIETKGILGNDGRPYILDLLRTVPPDLNFQFSETASETREMREMVEEVPEECRSLGYPREHRHSLASLRPELKEAFVQQRYELYVKMVAQGLSQLEDQDKATEQSEEDLVCEPRTGDTTTAADAMESQRRDVMTKACQAVGSVSDTRFDIRFNPDVCSPGVRFSAESVEDVQRQRKLLWDAAAFLLSNQIPAVLRDCLDHTAVPMDGGTLTSVLHQQGVNVRYLGTLLGELHRVEERGRLGHIKRLAVSEVIIRSAKHIFRTFLQDVEPAAFSAAVSHFLNCLLSSSSCTPDSGSDELLSRRRSRRRRSHGSRVALLTDSVWARLTPSELWGRIRAEAGDYFNYMINSDSIDEVIEKHGLQRISLLREIAIKMGIQVQLREYVFESRHRPVFGEEDVVNMFPVVKHLKPTATDATRLVQRAQVAVQQGLLRDGYELISQALTLFSSVCGVLHEDVCVCLRLLGRLSYILGEYADALSHQEKVVMSSERLQGIDHPQTIQDYTHLGLYCFAGGQLSISLKLLYRARYLTLLVSGEDHPQVALLDSMLGLVLHGLMEHELSLKFLQNALNLTSKYRGATSVRLAHSHHLLATVYETKGEFRSALQHEREAYTIYKSQVGENHDSTKESSEYLKSLTQQAVVLQKAINHFYSDTPGACVPPLKFSSPSLQAIIQQLNLTCGIILIPLSAKDLADLRKGMKRQDKVQVEELENQLLKRRKDTGQQN
ncbi:clustered mitochondria protein homolog isoform X1 [Hippoglossus stenolepis]|uniref:clustered mitochondria protein homolog isoform X1 n=1 Tax=Hippoglossus stenolepis TaxID=195615 RepID=UPI00159C9BB5|nr:clustered mitochondria protein homolog isoform X1 [Hippoglossus stenolepis]XP_047199442.1 clustered mitochondria protein homolog isoform X1 [Hippoglossus stenolepis]XP_047199443.1 clustered mitochondria protein homolog isoform X1 [Hippoglossus stenolepis]